MKEIYHEMPEYMLRSGYERENCSGHYALVHLYENNSWYFNYSVETLKLHLPLMLDNSIFELEKAFDADRFAYWIQMLAKFAGKRNVNKYLTYIIPDVLDDCDATIDSCKAFVKKYPKLPGKKMAVCQGKDTWELRRCYKELNEVTNLSRTGISFNCEAYKEPASDKLHSWVISRQEFLCTFPLVPEMVSPLHLLGCSLPQEFIVYQNDSRIVSVDTSNPVVHGLKSIPYTFEGLKKKESIKLVDLWERIPTKREMDCINWNVAAFRSFVNGY